MAAHVIPFPESFDNTLRLINREIDQVNERVVRITEHERSKRLRDFVDACVCPISRMICAHDCEDGCYRDKFYSPAIKDLL